MRDCVVVMEPSRVCLPEIGALCDDNGEAGVPYFYVESMAVRNGVDIGRVQSE